jgi:hypothetical protein
LGSSNIAVALVAEFIILKENIDFLFDFQQFESLSDEKREKMFSCLSLYFLLTEPYSHFSLLGG